MGCSWRRRIGRDRLTSRSRRRAHRGVRRGCPRHAAESQVVVSEVEIIVVQIEIIVLLSCGRSGSGGSRGRLRRGGSNHRSRGWSGSGSRRSCNRRSNHSGRNGSGSSCWRWSWCRRRCRRSSSWRRSLDGRRWCWCLSRFGRWFRRCFFLLLFRVIVRDIEGAVTAEIQRSHAAIVVAVHGSSGRLRGGSSSRRRSRRSHGSSGLRHGSSSRGRSRSSSRWF